MSNDQYREQIRICEEQPVRSDHHNWVLGQQAEYDSLHHRGRSLYDNLRTQFGWGHQDAYTVALEEHGASKAWLQRFER